MECSQGLAPANLSAPSEPTPRHQPDTYHGHRDHAHAGQAPTSSRPRPGRGPVCLGILTAGSSDTTAGHEGLLVDSTVNPISPPPDARTELWPPKVASAGGGCRLRAGSGRLGTGGAATRIGELRVTNGSWGMIVALNRRISSVVRRTVDLA